MLFELLVLLVILCNPMSAAHADTEEDDLEVTEAIGHVIEVLDEAQGGASDVAGEPSTTQTVRVEVISGALKGERFVTENVLSHNPAYDIRVSAGDKVLVAIEASGGERPDVYIEDRYRLNILFFLCGLFVTLVLVFAGAKGLRSLISLGITYLLIFYVLIPLVLEGVSPLPLTTAICLAATCITLVIVSGFNVKTLSAVLGTGGGVVAAGLLALVTIELAPLTGLPDQEAVGLWAAYPALDFKGILASGMIIGALGASMDVAISVASSMSEVKEAHPAVRPSELLRSGMNVGKDIMGTMTNTLLLAYTGGAIFLLLLVSGEISTLKLLNLDSIASEVSAAIVGSIGLVLCVPITAALGSLLIAGSRSKSS